MAMADCFYVTLGRDIFLEIVVYVNENASNFKLEEPRCFYGNSIRFNKERCCQV